jgi:4-hydroxy-3-polyprenylbenzoate decarboxylase
MVIAPCSIKTLSAIANSFNTNLLIRAADVCLKERRKLVLMLRETPLHLGHLRLMTQVTECGAVLVPPLPAFYHKPKTIEDLVMQSVNKALDQFDLDLDLFKRWTGNEEREALKKK